ncbi:MAG TPA: glycosyltransferase family 2 protein [Persephonella sp.]|nr:glycosyltransferase family 2 protein [Persephonella sp.]
MGIKSYPKIYLIILNYNNWADTIECLESVLRNDYPNYQVVVIDNNSSNNSMEYIKAWAEGKLNVWVKPDNPLRHFSFPPVFKPIPYVLYTCEEVDKGTYFEIEKKLERYITKGITTKYPLVLIEAEKNLGFAGGNNIGIKYAFTKGDFSAIVLLNNDTVVSKNSISEIINAWQKHEYKAIYSGRIFYYSDPNKIWYDGGHFNEWLGRTTHINIGKTKVPLKPLSEVNFVTFCFVLLPKELIEEVGLLNENYFMYVEDLDYSYRTKKRGYKLYHVSSAHIWHKVGASNNGEISPFSAYWMMRNRIFFILSRLKLHKKITSIIFILLSRCYKFIFFCIKGKKNIVKSQIKGFCHGFKSTKNHKLH